MRTLFNLLWSGVAPSPQRPTESVRSASGASESVVVIEDSLRFVVSLGAA
jgi:hypothetical protein